MREIEQKAFLARADSNDLTPSVCALRAAVELDRELARSQAVTGQRDSVEKAALDTPETRAAFSSSSFASQSAYLICRLCTQNIQLQDTHKPDGDSAIRIKVDFPNRCHAYSDVQATDIQAVHETEVKINQ